MIRKYHNHKLQTTKWHHEEEPLNHHETPGRQIKQSNQLSLPHQDDCNTRSPGQSILGTYIFRGHEMENSHKQHQQERQFHLRLPQKKPTPLSTALQEEFLLFPSTSCLV